MKTLVKKFHIVSICAVLVCLTAAMAIDDEEKEEEKAKLGEKAPEFKLFDAKDQQRSLSDYKDKIIVLEWTNPECEFVSNIYRTKEMQKAYKDVKKIDKSIVWLAINSGANTTAAKNNFWIQKYSIKYPILLDQNGAVAKTYNVRRTPHMVVIDKEGIIRYQGAIDDNNLMLKKSDEITNYVAKAVQQIVDDETVSTDTTKTYGCSIKQSK